MKHFQFAISKLIHAAILIALTGCGGGGGSTADKAPTPQPDTSSSGGTPPTTPAADPKPLTGAQEFSLKGSVFDDGPAKNARVTVFNTSGVSCGTSKSDEAGKYSIGAKCAFPLIVAADIPDANDPTGDATEGEGRKLFGVVPVITTKGQSFELNLSPVSTATTTLMLGGLPEPGSSTPATQITAERLSQAIARMKVITDDLAGKLGIEKPDLTTASTADGQPLGELLAMAPVSFERIASTKQTLIKFHVVTEHRPLTLVQTDGKPIEDAVLDGGLGLLLDAVDGARLKAGLQTVKALKEQLKVQVWSLGTMLDEACFLLKGGRVIDSLMDAAGGWQPGADSSVESVKLLRLNTYVDQDNETLERRNGGVGLLAYLSFDFRNVQGLKQRGYTWALKGKQQVNGCSAGADGEWRILGNQRRAYSRTTTYAMHHVLYSQAFGTRKDVFGSGIESFVESPQGEPFTHFLISGPGIPGDGVVFLFIDGAFLYSQATLLQLRQAANAAGATDLSVLTSQASKIRETRSIIFANDAAAKSVTDAFYDRQNAYTVRLFKSFKDLYPTLTYTDILPKRPRLSSSLKAETFPSVAVNVDGLVSALQLATSVDVNWSLPLDERGVQVKPRMAWISRLNCRDAKTWPSCTARKDQLNEWNVDLQYFVDPSKATTTLNPWRPADGLMTFKGMVRVQAVDSLNRPMESGVGMDYTR